MHLYEVMHKQPCGGAYVMDIVVGNGHRDLSSTLEQGNLMEFR